MRAGVIRSSLISGLVSGVAVALLVACLPDPKRDFDDFAERTASMSTGDVGGDASIDSRPPEQGVEQLYVGICVTSLAARDPAQALRFYTQTKYAPDPATGGGKLSVSVIPMVGWDKTTGDYISPTSVSKSETRGDPTTVNDVPVAAGTGRFTAVLGKVALPGEANSISGRDAVVENTTLDGRFGSDTRFCTTLGGQLKVPYSFTFDPKANTCLFVKAKEGDPLPVLQSEEFVCPL